MRSNNLSAVKSATLTLIVVLGLITPILALSPAPGMSRTPRGSAKGSTTTSDAVVREWNEIATQLIVVGSQSPVQQTRLMAIVHVAMHDAVSGITGDYKQYMPAAPGQAATSPEAAAIGAAHRALQGAVGDSTSLANSFAQSLAAHGLSPSDPSVRFGETVADGILVG